MSYGTRSINIGGRVYRAHLQDGKIYSVEVLYRRVTRPFTSPAETGRQIWTSWRGPGGRAQKITPTAMKVALKLGLSFKE